MKKVLFFIIILIGAAVVWKVAFSEPAPAKAYRKHREAMMSAKGFSSYKNITAPAKWSLKITKCEKKGSVAEVLATEETSHIPRGAASLAFATIITRDLGAQLERKDGQWVITKEDVLRKNISYYQDRKGGKR